MYTKTCPICGAEFEAANSRYKYCSDACRKEVENRRQTKRNNAEYYAAHKHKRKLYYKQHYKPVEKNCQGCGKRLEDGRQSWCLDCLLDDYVNNKSRAAFQRLSCRGYDKAMIMEEINLRRATT